jgi:hypothetical protein
MKIRKILAVVAALMLGVTVAWAGNIPEFDAVGCDAYNIFAAGNHTQYYPVIIHNIGPYGPINWYSDFLDKVKFPKNFELFTNTAGQLFPDPCFSTWYHEDGGWCSKPYLSALTDAYNEAIYAWWITLQMKPESDINLNIYDCVLKHNEFCVWDSAEQTGRYRADWGQLFFVPTANPTVTAEAYPGPFATPNFVAPFIMDARTLPGLKIVALKDALYSTKAQWSEGILMALPETGKNNASGQTVYNLKQGDQIRVTIKIPPNNTADVRYGPDNVILKYIGIIGTWYYGTRCAW